VWAVVFFSSSKSLKMKSLLVICLLGLFASCSDDYHVTRATSVEKHRVVMITMTPDETHVYSVGDTVFVGQYRDIVNATSCPACIEVVIDSIPTFK
jgi:hypothetical protein